METSLMVDDYPTPNEEKTKNISGTIIIECVFKDVEVPEDWTNTDIINDIKDNLNDYLMNSVYRIEDVEL